MACDGVGLLLVLVWIRTLVRERPPRPMPVDGLGAFWLGTSAALLLGVGALVREAVRSGAARAMGRPLATLLAAVGAHRVISGVFESEVREWMGVFVVPEGVLLLAAAGYLWWGRPRLP